jgi:hypothetical protein
MDADSKKKIQIVLVVAIVLAAVRAGYILYARHSRKTASTTSQPAALNPDHYVTPKKLRPYDLQSARSLTQQPVWVKEGYRYTFYRYNKAAKHADFSHQAGLLLPLEPLEIKDVVTDTAPGSPDQRQIEAVFEKQGTSYAVPIGSLKGENYQIYSDEMFFIENPHELYRHWPSEVWDAIGNHQVRLGMNELQADFAIGMATLEHSNDPQARILRYPNGGRPLIVTYRNGKAAEIKPAA